MRIGSVLRLINLAKATFALKILIVGMAAQAQVLEDIEKAITLGGQYDEVLQNIPASKQERDEKREIDGEAGVFILKKNEIFSLQAQVGTGYSTNPSRTLESDETKDSSAFQYAFSANVDTRLAQKIDAGANLIVSGTEFEDKNASDSSSVVINGYVGNDFFDGKVYGSVSTSYGLSMDGKFDNSTEFYGVTASASSTVRAGPNAVVQPRAYITRQMSEVTELNNISATVEVNTVYAPAPKWQINAKASYTWRQYDDFYEDVTFVERQDDVVRASVGVKRQLTESTSVGANISYVSQDSDFFLSDYNSFDGGVSFSFKHTF